MNSICLVGGSGFIGSRLVNRLRSLERREIIIIDKVPCLKHPDLAVLGDVRDLVPKNLGYSKLE
jgi:nucleoside-diphosphate-sugar epimerase